MRKFRKPTRLDPQNGVIRKRLWAVEHPEAFYTRGKVEPVAEAADGKGGRRAAGQVRKTV